MSIEPENDPVFESGLARHPVYEVWPDSLRPEEEQKDPGIVVVDELIGR